MQRNYFPDCNVLVGYLAERQDNSDDCRKVLDATGKGRQLTGYLLPGIDREFNGIASNYRLNSSVELIVKSLDPALASNSKPLLLQRIAKLESTLTHSSQKIVIEEVSAKIRDLQKIDSKEFRRLAYTVFYEFKQKRELVIAKLSKCEENTLSKIASVHKVNISNINQELAACFPIKKPSDSIDNQHIVEAICQCVLLKTSGVFVTADNLRRPNRTNLTDTFENMANKASLAINRLFSCHLEISKLSTFASKLSK